MNTSEDVDVNTYDNDDIINTVNEVISEDSDSNLSDVFYNIQSINTNQYSEDSVDEEQTTDYNNETNSFTFSMPSLDISNIATGMTGPLDNNLMDNYNTIASENISSLINGDLAIPNITTISDNSLYDISGNNTVNTYSHNNDISGNMVNTYSQTISFNQPTTPPGPPPGFNEIINTEPPTGSEPIEENPQYSMLNNEDVDNPFSKCKINKLDYDTDSEETAHIRVIITWSYQFNYEYFSLNNTNIFSSKNNLFNSHLDELKKFRNTNISNITGKIYKFNNNGNFSQDMVVDMYLIAYYDNVKSDIEIYGIFNQELDEIKLIENIKREGIYGIKGIVDNNNTTNLGEYDFIVIHKKLSII